MSVYLEGTSVLLHSGSVGTAEACCCNGACCHCDGTCVDGVSGTMCIDAGYQFYGNQLCAHISCVTGACCVGDVCTVETPFCCTNAGGTYQGDGTTCSPNPCTGPPTGACCVGEVCTVETHAACNEAGGSYQGDGTICTPNPCPGRPPCSNCYFQSFDGSPTQYKMASATYSGNVTFLGGVTAMFSGTITVSIGSDCMVTCSCSGTGSSSDGGTAMTVGCTNLPATDFCALVSGQILQATGFITWGCEWSDGGMGTLPCQPYPATCPPPVLSGVTSSTETLTWDCSVNGTWHGTTTITLSDPCDPAF